MDSAERFARNLRRERRSRDLSQEALAAKADVHRTEVSLLERGERDPRLSTVVRLAGALKISASELLDGVR